MDGLTAEDFRLLLNGVGDINVQTLIGYTSFNDESGENPDRLVAIKRWLWSIVEKMSPLEKQDLVFFWTGKVDTIYSTLFGVKMSQPRECIQHLIVRKCYISGSP